MKENDFLEPKSDELLAASQNPPHFTSITPRGELTLKKGPNINETLCKNTNPFNPFIHCLPIKICEQLVTSPLIKSSW